MRTVLALAGLLLAHEASADCTYHNGYYDPPIRGACVAETAVPEGCPVHVETPAGTTPELVLVRGGASIASTPAVTRIAGYQLAGSFIDPFDCACAMTPGTLAFDRFAIAVPEARDGDLLELEGGQLEEPRSIRVGPAGPCPTPVFEDAIHIATQCDRCPIDGDPSGDADPGGGGGCAAGGGGSALAVLGLLGLRRRQRYSASSSPPANTDPPSTLVNRRSSMHCAGRARLVVMSVVPQPADGSPTRTRAPMPLLVGAV